MPTWGQILRILDDTRPTNNGQRDYDGVRRRYLHELSDLTHRPAIIYSTAFMESRPNVQPQDLQISLLDVQAMMECMYGLQGADTLDLIIHSPGGTAEAAESVVKYLRSRFRHIRAIIPVAAMSAATMLALSCDEIVMGRHSQLGPIDPQFIVITPEGPRASPGQAILDQFEMAKEQCRDTGNLAAWMPILRTYAPGLLAMCVHHRELAENLVAAWIQAYMLAGVSDAAQRAKTAAAWFADYKTFKSHGRPVRIEDIRQLGLRVVALEDDQRLQDAVLSIHHATMHTFAGTPAVKIVENHLGYAFVKMGGGGIIQIPQMVPQLPPKALV